jgi:hypothetical protein
MHAVTRADAIKFADGTDIKVSCTLLDRASVTKCDGGNGGDDAERHELTITVQDGGRGMAADECARAFDAYFRAPAHRGGGTGLGALSRYFYTCACKCVARHLTRVRTCSQLHPQGCISASASWKVCVVLAMMLPPCVASAGISQSPHLLPTNLHVTR